MYLMWYSASNPTTYQSGAIGLAMSTNGTTWTKYAGNPVLAPTPGGYDSQYVAGPYVIQLPLRFNMWYTGRNVAGQSPGSNRILLATSTDGINWIKWPNPVLSPSTNSSDWDSGGLYAPSVIYDGKNFGLWYSGLNQTLLTPMIGFASSPDGATWVRSPSNPILVPGPPGSWDAAGVEQSSPVQVGASYTLYYDGGSSGAGGKIGLAFAAHGFVIAEFPAPILGLLIVLVGCSAIFLVQNRRRHKK